jgi:ribosomal-protein-alanine N-acetyltransferase
MHQYFLRSPRIGFRIWTPDDLQLAFGLWTDLEVTRFIGGPFTEQQVRHGLEQEISLQNSNGIQFWPIFELVSAAHIGCCGIRPYDPIGRIFEIGFVLRPRYWSKGYGSEASRTIVSHAFRDLGVQGLFAGHHPENEVSRRLLTRLGFRHTHDEFFARTGLEHPSYLLTREQFNAASKCISDK